MVRSTVLGLPSLVVLEPDRLTQVGGLGDMGLYPWAFLTREAEHPLPVPGAVGRKGLVAPHSVPSASSVVAPHG